MNPDDLKPISSHIEANTTDNGITKVSILKGDYKNGLIISSDVDGKTTISRGNVPAQYIDNEYLAMAIRCFNIKKGFSTEVNISSISVGKVATLTLKYAGIEKVKVPYGEFECYKLDFYDPTKTDISPLNFWISTD